MVSFRKSAQCVGALCLGVAAAHAQTTPVDLHPYVNANLRTWTEGWMYPVGGTPLNVGGTPFMTTILDGDADSLGIIASSDPYFVDIDVAVFGVRTIYTLMNTAWGRWEVLEGRLEAFGSGGAYASLDLIEGHNIRDHWIAYETRIDAGTASIYFGNGNPRLDRQVFALPVEFGSQTLEKVRFTQLSHSNPNGAPFMAAMTVSTLPEPASLSVLAAGAWLMARKRRH